MKNDNREMARRRLDGRLAALRPVDRFQAPQRGWIRAIRDALGMSGPQLGSRLGITPQSIDALEKSEAAGSVQLSTLRRAAEAMDCTLVYALVPNRPLQDMVRVKARERALIELGRVAHTMQLEAQGTGDEALEDRIEAFIRDHLKARDLWSGP